MINYNLHQHSIFSDGKDAPEDYIKHAISIDFKAIGFSEHSPLPFDNPFSLKKENVDQYVSLIDQLKIKYLDKIAVYRALEMDFIPSMSEDFDYWRKQCKVDYLIGSVHLVKPKDFNKLWFTDGPDYQTYDQGVKQYFDGDIKKAVKAFFEQTNTMIDTQNFEIIGHFDKIKMHNRNRFFTENEKWYKDLIDETIGLIKKKDLIVEVNTRGLYKKRSVALFPDDYALKKVKESGIPIIVSSDAHQATEVNELFYNTEQYLVEFGFKELMYFNNGIWETRPMHA